MTLESLEAAGEPSTLLGRGKGAPGRGRRQMLTRRGEASSLPGKARGPGLAEGWGAGGVLRTAGATQVGAPRLREGLWLWP